MPTPVPPEVLAAARAAAEDSLVRFAAGDTSVTDEEAFAYRNLIHALKLSGVRSPVMELIARVGLPGVIQPSERRGLHEQHRLRPDDESFAVDAIGEPEGFP